MKCYFYFLVIQLVVIIMLITYVRPMLKYLLMIQVFTGIGKKYLDLLIV